jgi:TonB family protein
MKRKFNKISVLCFLILSFVFSAFAQQTERDKGIELFKQNNFGGAIASLKKATKTDSSDAQSWYYLGLSYLKKNEPKNSIKAFQKAVELSPKDANARVGLAYAHLMKNNANEADQEARKSLELNPKISEAHYIIGVIGFRNGSYNLAYERAAKAIELNPNLAAAYLLKSESLISSFTQQAGTVVKPPNGRKEMLKEAAQDLEKYLNLLPANDKSKFYSEYLESVSFFAEYYNQPGNQLPKNLDAVEPTTNTIPLKITYKPRALYTNEARSAGVSGTIELMVGFSADGTVKHILVVKPLGYGLDEEAVKAARKIKFQPSMKDGKPISIVKRVQYSFSIG